MAILEERSGDVHGEQLCGWNVFRDRRHHACCRDPQQFQFLGHRFDRQGSGVIGAQEGQPSRVDMSITGSSEYTSHDGMFQDRTSVDIPCKKIAAAAVDRLAVDIGDLLKADPLIHVSLYECDCRRQWQHRRC